MADSATDAVAAAQAILNDDTLRARPRFCVDGLEPEDQTALVLDALSRNNEPPTLFSRGNGLVRVGERHGMPLVQELSLHALCAELVKKITLVHRKRDEVTGEVEETPYWPPRRLIETLHEQGRYPKFPELRQVITTPTFAPNGELIDQPGFHAASGLLYQPAPGFSLPRPVPAKPSDRDVTRALDMWVTELLGDFPFVSAADQAHALSLGLERFVRSLVDGPTPLRLFSKPTHGSGATLLANVLLTPGLGRLPSSTSEKRNEDDMRKWISSVVLGGQPLLYIGNLHKRLESPALSEAITQTWWTDRILGVSQIFEAPVHQTFVATANNPKITAEVARRGVLIRLDPRTEKPWERTGFHHPKLETWVVEKLGELTWSGLVIVQSWLEAGQPIPADLPAFGSFEAWTQVHGGILAHLGVTGFLANREQLFEDADAQTGLYRTFLGKWWDTFRGDAKLATDLVALAVDADLLDAQAANAQALGNLLGELYERTIGLDPRPTQTDRPAAVVIQRSKLQGRNHWQLKPASTDTDQFAPDRTTWIHVQTANSGASGTSGAPSEIKSTPKRGAPSGSTPPEAVHPESETVGVAPQVHPEQGGYTQGYTQNSADSEIAGAPRAPVAPENAAYVSIHAWQCRACRGELTGEAELLRGLHTYCLEPVPW
jgi:hypothetical protein